MVLEAANRFLAFVNQAPTPFHAVLQASILLEKAGFKKIRESDNWDSKIESGKYYFTRNQSSLLAFVIPPGFKPGNGLSIVATHVDSPNLRVRPISKKLTNGYLQVGVETYGGGIWHTWFDRDLSIAGRVIVGQGKSGSFESRLVKVDRPILRIPSLAIHLDRGVNEAFKFNTETEMTPILGLVAKDLNKPISEADATTDTGAELSAQQKTCHSEILSLLESHGNCSSADIHDFELHLYDTQPSSLGGANNEFVFSPRLDNLLSSYCAVESIIDADHGSDGNISVAALFNHEEIGSVSTTGAESSLLPTLINRLSPTPTANAQSIAKSFLISADMGHAIHPNYAKKHQDEHRPLMNGGVVIKTNAKQRYASDNVGSFLVKQLIQMRGGSVQEFEVRNDIPCGSTVGPMLSKLGMRTIDVGVAQLSMHSIRETCGSQDVQAYIDLFRTFYEKFCEVDGKLRVD